jgi:succinate dehydrogenase / fumarate reductase, cytochrome b subunit
MTFMTLSPSALPPKRPLSPHLQVYRWGPHMLVSILHRITGNGLALVGAVLLVWWLAAAAAGPQAYLLFQDIIGSWLGRLVLFGLSWSFFQHLCSGIRHLYLDTGQGYALGPNRLSSLATLCASGLLTFLLWAFILFA